MNGAEIVIEVTNTKAAKLTGIFGRVRIPVEDMRSIGEGILEYSEMGMDR